MMLQHTPPQPLAEDVVWVRESKATEKRNRSVGLLRGRSFPRKYPQPLAGEAELVLVLVQNTMGSLVSKAPFLYSQHSTGNIGSVAEREKLYWKKLRR
jgi:hypothetical protein